MVLAFSKTRLNWTQEGVPVPARIIASGIASPAIALLLILYRHSNADWPVGLLVGINLFFTGAWLRAVGSALRQAAISAADGGSIESC